MTAEAMHMELNCRTCGCQLSLIDMHLYDHGDGTANCEQCDAVFCFEAGVLPLGLEDEQEGDE